MVEVLGLLSLGWKARKQSIRRAERMRKWKNEKMGSRRLKQRIFELPTREWRQAQVLEEKTELACRGYSGVFWGHPSPFCIFGGAVFKCSARRLLF